MRRRKFLVSGVGALAGAKHLDVKFREYSGEALERAIAERIGDDGHRWVDVEFPYRGESEPYYQILDVHHNLTALDGEAQAAVDDLTREWNLTLEEEATAANGLDFRTLTLDSEDPREHRELAETILQRIYGVELAHIADVTQVDGEPDSDDGDAGGDGGDETDADADAGEVHVTTMKENDWMFHARYDEWLHECYEVLVERGGATGVEFLDVTDLPGLGPPRIDYRPNEESPYGTLSRDEYRKRREQRLHAPTAKQARQQNDWLGDTLLPGLHVLAEHVDGDIRPPEGDVPPREQHWRYAGDGTDVDPGAVEFRELVVDAVFDDE
ncbi:hypothetical protein BRC90_06845 [Halobacteriales archaeon QS_4_69_34]|nr:MAG: hypothetical protein BRC90_06845 [Halobacteriales archaeon QS_4_69_34]